MAMHMDKLPVIFFAVFLLLDGAIQKALANCGDWAAGNFNGWGGNGNGVSYGSNSCLYPWRLDNLPNEPRPNFYKDLDSCVASLTDRCMQQKYDFIMEQGDRMDEECCRNLLGMARGCDDSITWTIVSTDRYGRDEDQIKRRTEAEFSRCQRVLSDPGYYNNNPYDNNPYNNFLKKKNSPN